MQSDGLFQGIDIGAYHLLEGVQFLGRLLSGATPTFEPVFEDLEGEVDPPIVGDELVEFHDAPLWTDAALGCLRRSHLELWSAREAFYPAVEPVEGGEDLLVSRPVRDVCARVEVTYFSRLIYDDDGRYGHALLFVPQAAHTGDLSLGVTEEGERKLELPDHPRVVGWRVDADAGYLRPPALELFELPGEAGQLPVAVGGPVAPVEDQHHGPRLQLTREAPGIVLLIRQLEVRDLLPDTQPGHVTLLPVCSSRLG